MYVKFKNKNKHIIGVLIVERCKKNNLENNENSQIIHPDEKLQTLLGIDKNDKLTYFTLQKHMNKHFIKKTKQTAEI